MTDLYVLAAYAAEPVEAEARERAIVALNEMRGQIHPWSLARYSAARSGFPQAV